MTADISSIERACARLISQYAYLNDERRFDELSQLFSEDALLYRPSAPEQAIRGRAAILQAFEKRPANAMTFHICSDILIDVKDETCAVGRSRILLLSAARPEDGQLATVESKVPVPGVFHDVFRLTGQGWQFAERRGAFWIPVVTTPR